MKRNERQRKKRNIKAKDQILNDATNKAVEAKKLEHELNYCVKYLVNL